MSRHEFHDVNVTCPHRERQPDLITFTFTDPGTPACDACSLAHAKEVLADALRALKWAQAGEAAAQEGEARLRAQQHGWRRRAERLTRERDEADQNAGRMQRENVALRRQLVEDATRFVKERMLPPEPSPGPARGDWYRAHKEPTDKLLNWLKNWSFQRPEGDE